ncbi:MAG: tRNA (adenosine(37)-N6)-threonylcarbamoyltransferase complex transferase subunit TsaD [Alphaproteobacteria bacterium]|nr:tRNA (adenosine(37)-N6)-threonylcarbamoyltransferase complex transferase subunit TsaD [Alphaproteobacteria bacterium]
MKILGIETSCDETAAAVVQGSAAPSDRILSNVILSQIEEHEPYGGVVPEIAARAHLNYLPKIIQQALTESNISLDQINAIAVTGGPGLIGGVLVGIMAAKAMAIALNKPLLAINHLEGHALTIRLTHDLLFPYLLLLASGGHCQFVLVSGLGRYHVLGRTIDDAAGEAFDKIAKLMGLDYPGGPALEQCAKLGDPNRFDLPRPLSGRVGCDLSFSGLKTATRLLIQKSQPLSEQMAADISACFQHTVAESLAEKANNAIQMIPASVKSFVVAGGVAANQTIRNRLQTVCDQHGLAFLAPPLRLCTDNAAMIAWAGLERMRLGLVDDLSFAPRPRWPLCDLMGNELDTK